MRLVSVSCVVAGHRHLQRTDVLFAIGMVPSLLPAHVRSSLDYQPIALPERLGTQHMHDALHALTKYLAEVGATPSIARMRGNRQANCTDSNTFGVLGAASRH